MQTQKHVHPWVVALALALGVGLASASVAHAQLGLTIDPTEGVAGTVVSAQVNPADVAANCTTTVEGLQAKFQDLLAGPFVGGNTEGELPQRFFPDPNNIVYENPAQLAYVLTLLVGLGLAENIEGATEDALPQTFVLTFADIATQEPVGERSTFDPNTGEGSVVTPDVTPGLWAVAATCVTPVLDIDALEAGIRESGEFLESIGAQFGPEGPFSPDFVAFMQDFLDTDLEGFELLIAFVGAIGPSLLEPIVVPQALGVQLFTVLAEPGERIAGVIADIQALVDAGELKAGQAQALLSILRNAARSLERGKTHPACQQLASFAAVANAKVKAKALAADEAAALIAEVESIRAQLGCDEPVGSPSGAFLDGCEMHF